MKTLRTLSAVLFLTIFSVSCQKTAIANFRYTENGVKTISFTNTSTNASSYTWNFGDGSSSTETSPVHTYNNLGSYTVTLTAHSSGGDGTNTQNITVY